ncbi:MAG TPA: ubiquitin-activating E1 FCCH domain-containing protein [Thermoplasmata archaeon]|nr:ubiquitin-activating E1 FCCH domain-containing protein [Thermoplasmata archaeon]
MSNVVHRSFSGGEITPAIYARVDVSRYQSGLRTCRNFFIARHGGAYNRPGTRFICETKDSTKQSRLIPFIFNEDQAYILEFGDLYMRIVRDGAQQLETLQTITGATAANPVVVTCAGHGYLNGEEVNIQALANGVVAGIATSLVGRNYIVANKAANTFELTGIDGTGFSAFSANMRVGRVYEIATPYAEADLFDLHFVQSADVISIVHRLYAPREIRRTGHTAWTLTQIAFRPTTTHPTACAGTGTVGVETHKYKVTAANAETLEESLPGVQASVVITDITEANPAVVTSGGHGYANGDTVLIAGVVGMTEVNNRRFVVAGQTANTFQLQGENSTNYTAYGSAGTAAREEIYVASVTAPATNAHTITWTAVTGVREYYVYKAQNDVYGFIGTAGSASFIYDGTPDPDTAETPPRERNPFQLAGGFPATVGYYQQRRIFAGSDDLPETVFASKTGFHANFTTSFPLRDDDSIRFSLVGRQVNRIRSVIDLGSLVVMTSGSEWSAEGDSAGTLTPGSINLRQQTYNGSSTVAPLIVDKNALYVQDRGSIVRDLRLAFEVDGYTGNDLTIFAAHLFDGYTLTDWAFQKIPNSIVWAVRSDGVVLGLTYLHDHQILAWHRHEIGTAVESVETVPVDTEDRVYFIVRRTIDGATVRSIEELQTRSIGDADDMIFMDYSLTYDGRNTDATHTVTLTDGTTWDNQDILTLTHSAAVYGGGVGDEFHLFTTSGAIVRCEILTAPAVTTTGTVFTVRPDRDVPASLQGVATTSWSRAKASVTGLWHLEGEDVSILGDGSVIGSPNDSGLTTYTVADGVVTLDLPHAVVHVGIPYISDIETLDIDFNTLETIADRKSGITNVGLFVESSRGIYVGIEEPTGTDPIEGLTEMKLRDSESYDDPPDLKTEFVEVNVAGAFRSGGRVFARQIDPLPLAILSAVPSGSIPGGR